ncbi:MAG: LysE family translocator [Cytophagales bacterium]|nr:LysE family translocator [Cytophagales bacterium]
MELGVILSFIGAAVILSLMPGPDNLFVLIESLTKGPKNGIAISVGLGLGVLIHTLAAATGLSIIIQKSAIAFSIVKYFGAFYLFYLAFTAYKEKQVDLKFHTTKNRDEVRVIHLIRKGFLMNVLNPKVSLFFIAFLPQFVTGNGYNVTVQMILLGVIFMIQALLIFGLVAVLSGRLTKYVNNPRFWKIAKWGKVSALSVLGLTLAVSRR